MAFKNLLTIAIYQLARLQEKGADVLIEQFEILLTSKSGHVEQNSNVERMQA